MAMTNDVTADRSWTVADMADGTLTTVKAGRGGTATSNTFEFDAVQYIVGYGTDVASLSFATSRERQRSGDITSALTNGDRYVIRFTAPSSVDLRAHAAAFLIAQVQV